MNNDIEEEKVYEATRERKRYERDVRGGILIDCDYKSIGQINDKKMKRKI